ncbi:2-succinyl-5-enolpyruvyl-6-hydroxy-3-cyclohexene-1-carboxylic-acid synthase [Halobacteriovorax marinus]|mgnify:CR=1 FL=1|uniref:2-succinyl-5-enolpyruvyl-6-hydroxy-3-cyclohexene-1-carboxylate synthase n=1 Tax=Halobacteriovorax marinus TaxID=97084 RepID=A0A1Y5F9U8_9BACT|nr:2-succinyl-5-enolpyruvyl-6-hydroxy-3-cyclohexene-1-carboxylic-acid synthase [Halobacteriovorax marinus]
MLLAHNLSNLWSSLIIDELIKSNVVDFYISPGMRNAPLVNSLLKRDNVNLYLGIDERAQAYRALGNAKGTGRTSALICTSGTALANYMPAIIEAKKSFIPMVVLSADRPIELSTSDANQTINQVHFYGAHVRADACLGAPTEQIEPHIVRNTVNHLIFRSLYPTKGPVHLNIPLREPLDSTKAPISESYIERARETFKILLQTEYLAPLQSLSSEVVDKISDIVKHSERGLLVIGQLPSSMDKSKIKAFIKKLNWPVFLDISSSLKYSYSLEDNVIPTFDHQEVYDKVLENIPSTIIHLGGRTTSKHYYRFLSENPLIKLISVNWSDQKEDPSQNTDIRIVSHVDQFCLQLTEKLQQSCSPIKVDWKEFVQKKEEVIKNSPLCYPYISKSIIENIASDTALYISNSTVVRAFDNYISTDKTKEIDIFTNRGVSGIEGLIASTIGCAEGISKFTTLVIGDISFLHDLNSLQMLKESKAPVCVVLVNNSGGGIFSLLPIAKDKELLPYLTTPHELNFEHGAKLFNLDYQRVETPTQFDEVFRESQKVKRTKIIEVIVDNEKNIEIYNLLKTVKL